MRCEEIETPKVCDHRIQRGGLARRSSRIRSVLRTTSEKDVAKGKAPWVVQAMTKVNPSPEMPFWQQEFIKLLNKTLAEHQKKNPKFSLRSFAAKLSISHGSLSDLLRGRATWTMTPDRAAEILGKLKAPATLKNKILVAMKKEPFHVVKPITPENFNLLTDWTYQPILLAFDLKSEFHKVEAISARLGVPVKKVKDVIGDLLKRGFLVKKENGRLSRPEVFLEATAAAPPDKATIRKFHQVGLEMAQRALDEIPSERRDITSLTFIGSEKKLAELTKEIRNLYKIASATVDGGEDNDCIYKMSIQLYPIEFPNEQNN